MPHPSGFGTFDPICWKLRGVHREQSSCRPHWSPVSSPIALLGPGSIPNVLILAAIIDECA